MVIATSQRLRLRLPGWCKAPCVTVKGAAIDLASLVEGGYVGISRTWQDGDVVAPPKHRAPLTGMCLAGGALWYYSVEVDGRI
jgi:hypothetical protein